MEVLLGRDALLQFEKEGEYVDYACCESFEVSFSTETKSVKTLGDGQWARERAQKHSCSITASGVIRIDDTTKVNGFDLYEYQRQGAHVAFRAIFKENDSSTVYTMIYGYALVVSSTFSAPVDFVNHSIEMRVMGEPTVGIMPTCSAEISDYTVDREGITFVYQVAIQELVSGTVPTYVYALDGGAPQTATSTGWSFSVAGTASPYGDHVLEIWPVCENGALGVKETYNFTHTL
jgi:hypothetical protein